MFLKHPTMASDVVRKCEDFDTMYVDFSTVQNSSSIIQHNSNILKWQKKKILTIVLITSLCMSMKMMISYIRKSRTSETTYILSTE